MAQPTWDPEKVPYVFLSTTEEALSALTVLKHADEVAIDTETVVERDENGEIIPRDLDVDGPGAWRVMTIAARYGSGPRAEYRSWILDMKDIAAVRLVPLFAGIRRPWAWQANFERFVFARDGLPIRRWWDGMLFAAALRQGAYKGTGTRPWYPGLAETVKQYFGVDLEGKDDVRTSYDAATPLTDEQKRYAVLDALWLLKMAETLVAEVKKHNLHETAVRECNAQAFINGFTRNGFPFDREGYQRVLDDAQAKADDAAERIALATTGKEMLDTVIRYAVSSGRASKADMDAGKIDGVALLHDPEFFRSFLAAVTRQIGLCKEKLAELLNAGPAQEDLFSNEPLVILPFDIDNDVDVRKWVSKTLPAFAQAFMAQHGTVKRNLTKDHDLTEVLAALADSTVAGVTDAHRAVAITLLSYRRYAKIAGEYGSAVGVVRLKPDWNINSPDQLKAMLNTYAAEQIAAYTAKKDGQAHALGQSDSTDSDALKLIGGPLCEALLDYRKHSKVVTTYGDELLKAVNARTGRIHAKYTQCLVATGRLASFAPNAQNLSPLAKPYIKPKRATRTATRSGRRVLVQADLSQAELRYAAHLSQDTNMLDAFRSGIDLHKRTASLMFGVDMDKLEVDDPGQFDIMRQSAKAPGFGYCYGLSGAKLANDLTVKGIPTTPEQGKHLLAQFEKAYPQLAAYMATRVAFIKGLAEAMTDMSRPSGCDFEASWRLHRLYGKAASAQKTLKNKLGRPATYAEIAEHISPREEMLTKLEVALGHAPSEEEITAEINRRSEAVGWALGHYGSAVLADDGSPWSFESRTLGGRRRLFQVGTGDWILAMAFIAARSRVKQAAAVRDAWVESYNARIVAEHEAKRAAGKAKGQPKTIALTKINANGRVVTLSNDELEKAFENRDARLEFVSYVLEAMPHGREYLFRAAVADRIKAMGNQFRNHPIQGGVGDAVLEAYAKIDDELAERFPTAMGVQSVHDSIVVECDIEDALAIRDLVKRIMEECLSVFCPSVPAKADADIHLSLYKKDKLSDEELQRLIAEEEVKSGQLAVAA